MRPSSVRTPRSRRLPGAASLGALAVLLLLASPVGAAPVSGHALRASDQPYSSYGTGRVNVILPSLLPDVTLQDAQNASIGADLSVDQILEVAPGASTPQVVAVAFPSHLSAFNGTAVNGSSALPVSLTATLNVLPAQAALWAGPDSTVTPDGGPLGVARLAINYSLSTSASPSTGVSIHWTVTGWPWLNATDLLGVQLGLTTQGGNGLTACGPSGSPGGGSPCPGSALSPGRSIWGSSFAGLEGETSNGPVASVTWAAAGTTATGSTVPVTAGALGQTTSYGHLFVGAAAGSSPLVGGRLSFVLVNPSLPIAPTLVRGEAVWFAGSAVAFGAAGLVALVVYRRRNREIERTL